MRQRLQTLADRIAEEVGPFGHRVFVDSAPVLERALARNAGLGWIGKHTCLIDKDGGSWFFLGEIYVDLPLPVDAPASAHCGTCMRCIDICPTQAIVAPYRLDARRCIAYLTIEHEGAIPEELRAADRQPHLRLRRLPAGVPLEQVRASAPTSRISARATISTRRRWPELFAWSEEEFLQRTEGSAIRRSGYERWLRNIAVALGNAPTTPEVVAALRARRDIGEPVVREHVEWALRAAIRPRRAERAGDHVTGRNLQLAQPHRTRLRAGM